MTRAIKPTRSEKEGYLYAAEKSGRIKIGWSIDPNRRCWSLRAQLLAVRLGSRVDERDVLDALAPHSIGREWFSDCPEVRSVFIRWHSPDWLDIKGQWMPGGRIVGVDEAAVFYEPASVEETRGRSTYRAKRRWSGWVERDNKADDEPLGLDGLAA